MGTYLAPSYTRCQARLTAGGFLRLTATMLRRVTSQRPYPDLALTLVAGSGRTKPIRQTLVGLPDRLAPDIGDVLRV